MSKKIIVIVSVLVLLGVGGAFLMPDILAKDAGASIVELASKISKSIKNLPPPKEYKDHKEEGGIFELPVNGASGYASVELRLREKPNTESEILAMLAPGQGFCILEEEGDWWHVQTDANEGWVNHDYCMINLPDVLPSIVYKNTNASASVLQTSGKDIPGITGEKLYDAERMNPRFGQVEFVMPTFYSTAKRIANAQSSARDENNTLVIYEAFRPYEVQRTIVNALDALSKSDVDVMAGLTQSPWSIGWFISTSLSNHQRGVAMDVSLAKITEEQNMVCGDYVFSEVTRYEEYEMPSHIHELSPQSATFSQPIPTSNDGTWKEVPLALTMNEYSIKLQSYCADAGLTPLASEWWHFDDTTTLERVREYNNKGEYHHFTMYSTIPNQEET